MTDLRPACYRRACAVYVTRDWLVIMFEAVVRCRYTNWAARFFCPSGDSFEYIDYNRSRGMIVPELWTAWTANESSCISSGECSSYVDGVWRTEFIDGRAWHIALRECRRTVESELNGVVGRTSARCPWVPLWKCRAELWTDRRDISSSGSTVAESVSSSVRAAAVPVPWRFLSDAVDPVPGSRRRCPDAVGQAGADDPTLTRYNTWSLPCCRCRDRTLVDFGQVHVVWTFPNSELWTSPFPSLRIIYYVFIFFHVYTLHRQFCCLLRWTLSLVSWTVTCFQL